MVVLKKGDWVLTKDRGIGFISVGNYMNGFHLVEFGLNTPDYTNYLYQPKELTKLPEELYPILSDSISNGERDG